MRQTLLAVGVYLMHRSASEGERVNLDWLEGDVLLGIACMHVLEHVLRDWLEIDVLLGIACRCATLPRNAS